MSAFIKPSAFLGFRLCPLFLRVPLRSSAFLRGLCVEGVPVVTPDANRTNDSSDGKQSRRSRMTIRMNLRGRCRSPHTNVTGIVFASSSAPFMVICSSNVAGPATSVPLPEFPFDTEIVPATLTIPDGNAPTG